MYIGNVPLSSHPLAEGFTSEVRALAGGFRGIRQTLRIMRQLVTDYKISLPIRHTAISLVIAVPEKDEFFQASELFCFVRDTIHYIKDVHNVETLQSPDKTLQIGAGDCDDQTTLLCCLLESIGIPTRFVVAGYSNKNDAEHVYCQALLNGEWISMDPTERGYGMDQEPPNPQCLWVESVKL